MRKYGRIHGFTLIEMIVVMVIVGVLMGLVTVNLDSLTPSSRLEATARKISSTLVLGLNHAAVSGKPTVIRYDLNDKYCQLYISAATGNGYEPMKKVSLAKGVRYKDIDIAGDKKHTKGWVEVQISPLNTLAGHAIHLINEEKMEFTIEVNPITGLIDIREGYHDLRFLEKV